MLAPRMLYKPSCRSSAAMPAVQRTAAPQRRRCVAPVAATGAAGSAAVSHEALAAQVAEKERELQAMFEPGKVQPRAGVVAALRKEISLLRSQLQGELGVASTSSRANNSVAGPAAASTAGVASYTSGAASAAAPSTAQKRLLDALKLAEAQMAASRQAQPGSLSQLSFEQQQELLRLQEENGALKAQLDVVHARQAQLQLLWEQHMGSSSSAAVHSSSSFANGVTPAPRAAVTAAV